MHFRLTFTKPLLIIAILAASFLCTTLAQAQSNIVPWMTGTFQGGLFWVGMFSPDGLSTFNLNFNPVVGDLNWITTCYDQWSCYSYANAAITGGTVNGDLYNGQTLIATFSGAVTGGSVFEQQWTSWPDWHNWEN